MHEKPRSLGRGVVTLLCACDNPETCHRRVVARLLEADGHKVTELRDWLEKPETLPLFT